MKYFAVFVNGKAIPRWKVVAGLMGLWGVAFIMFLALLSQVGCSSIGKMICGPPEVKILGVQPNEIGWVDVLVSIDGRVQKLEGMSYGVFTRGITSVEVRDLGHSYLVKIVVYGQEVVREVPKP